MAHGGNGFTLGVAAKLKKNTALKYLHEVSALIADKLKDKWMGYGILEQSPTYMENCRSRFHARHGFPMVGAAIDGTHVPYAPNSPEEALICKNYKMWTSLLNIAVVNSYYCFVELDVGWPGRFHDKTCTENSNFWYAMNANSETWLGRYGVALADSAWGVGSNLVMTPYTVNDGSTKARQWYNFVHSSTRFFVEEVFGRWKNRFRCLLTLLHFTYEHTKTIIFATAILHNMCQLCNDLDNSYFDGTDGSIPGHKTFGFPVTPLAAYEAAFPLSKIICPRCKQMSNGVMTSTFRNGEMQGHGCDCFSRS